MRRALLTVALAGAVMPFAAEAITAIWTALTAPSAGAALHAAGGTLGAAVALWLAVALLSLGDDPPAARLPLYDRRALLGRLARSHASPGAMPSNRQGAP